MNKPNSWNHKRFLLVQIVSTSCVLMILTSLANLVETSDNETTGLETTMHAVLVILGMTLNYEGERILLSQQTLLCQYS